MGLGSPPISQQKQKTLGSERMAMNPRTRDLGKAVMLAGDSRPQPPSLLRNEGILRPQELHDVEDEGKVSMEGGEHCVEVARVLHSPSPKSERKGKLNENRSLSPSTLWRPNIKGPLCGHYNRPPAPFRPPHRPTLRAPLWALRSVEKPLGVREQQCSGLTVSSRSPRTKAHATLPWGGEEESVKSLVPQLN